jgi:hypothetical protein
VELARSLVTAHAMTWTRVCFTDAQIAAGDDYRLQRKFTKQWVESDRSPGAAMFSTPFLPGQATMLYFSPAVSAEFASFAADVGAEVCDRPALSVALRMGAIDARELLEGA